jgi:hypothetical protein
VEKLPKPPKPPQPLGHYATEADRLFRRSVALSGRTEILRFDTVTKANDLQRRRQENYDRARWISYVLFTIGWGLALYSKLFMDGNQDEGGMQVV